MSEKIDLVGQTTRFDFVGWGFVGCFFVVVFVHFYPIFFPLFLISSHFLFRKRE